MNINEIKEEKQKRFDELSKTVCMFFAFSNQQFAENKVPLEEGDKYVSLGAGAYMPKSKVDAYLDGSKSINKWYKAAIKENKQRKANILYELQNHEAFYTGTIESTMEALGDDYTPAEVWAVYKSEYNKQVVY